MLPSLEDGGEGRWLAVIGRALAFLSLHAADLRNKDIGEQAEFLFALGLSRDEIAPLVGSTPASIEFLLRQRRKKSQGGNRGAKKASKGKR
jgi:CRP-like cAMP-binding protein